MSVVVFGSINMDLVVQVPHLPAAGETLLGYSFVTVPGGKGANQAVACARLGSPIRMVGRVGSDAFGVALLDSLTSAGVDTTGITQGHAASGVAVIAVDAAGENNIVVVPGANSTLDESDLRQLDAALTDARVLLLQLEVPLQRVVEAAHVARRHGAVVVLDPAPAQPLPAELYPLVDVLTPNQSEAGALVGMDVYDENGAAEAARRLLRQGVSRVVIKLGERGAYWADGESSGHLPAFRVSAVDTVAAGDAFNGALAVALASGQPWLEALRWAGAAGALATTKRGAQEAMPTRDEVLKLLGSS